MASFLYYIIVPMAIICYLATVAEASAEASPMTNSRAPAAKLYQNAQKAQNALHINCENAKAWRTAFNEYTISSLKDCWDSFKVLGKFRRSKKPCPDPDPAPPTRRRLLQEVVEWDQMLFECSTACTSATSCAECDETVASDCGDALSMAGDEWYSDYTDPNGQWTAKCALAADVADPELGTQCAVCFIDLQGAAANSTSTPSAGCRSVHGDLLMSSVLAVALLLRALSWLFRKCRNHSFL